MFNVGPHSIRRCQIVPRGGTLFEPVTTTNDKTNKNE